MLRKRIEKKGSFLERESIKKLENMTQMKIETDGRKSVSLYYMSSFIL